MPSLLAIWYQFSCGLDPMCSTDQLPRTIEVHVVGPTDVIRSVIQQKIEAERRQCIQSATFLHGKCSSFCPSSAIGPRSPSTTSLTVQRTAHY
jgi:hypothetical protein